MTQLQKMLEMTEEALSSYNQLQRCVGPTGGITVSPEKYDAMKDAVDRNIHTFKNMKIASLPELQETHKLCQGHMAQVIEGADVFHQAEANKAKNLVLDGKAVLEGMLDESDVKNFSGDLKPTMSVDDLKQLVQEHESYMQLSMESWLHKIKQVHKDL